jgi:hypothetical protein
VAELTWFIKCVWTGFTGKFTCRSETLCSRTEEYHQSQSQKGASSELIQRE